MLNEICVTCKWRFKSPDGGFYCGNEMSEYCSKELDYIVGCDKWEGRAMTQIEILKRAKRVITKDKQDKYGNAENNFNLIADLWTAYTGHELFAHDVAMMMCLLKIARCKTGTNDSDNYVDLCGYAVLGGEISGRLAE